MPYDYDKLPVGVAYVGEIRKADWNDATVDQWRVEFSSKTGFWNTDYFTGVGLRNKANKPVKPSIKDIMYSLISDADAADYNFHDWCAEFDHSDDSIKALNIYKKCLEIATNLRKYVGREDIEAMRLDLQDY